MSDTAKVGRPTDCTPELSKEICDAIASTNKGLRKLCEENDCFPIPNTIYRWLATDKKFREQYARAKQLQIETLVDEILEIADDASSDYAVNEAGKLVVNHDHIQRAKLRIDTRKWLASKLVPKVYGDRIQADLTDDVARKEVMQRIKNLAYKLMAEKREANDGQEEEN